MKNALILHGTNSDSQGNWFPWLQQELQNQDWKVWTPNLPNADEPNCKRYNQFLLKENEWDFNNASIIIGHSSGAVAILHLLQALPENVSIDTCYLIGSFTKDLVDTGWTQLEGLFTEPFNFDVIKKKAKKFVFIHADDDPHCPLGQAKYLANQIDGELIIQKGQKHFSIGTAGEKYKEFPFLLKLIQEK